MQSWLRRKDIDQITVHEEGRRLVPTLGWPHLVALGIGAIVGTGIYTLIGVGADKAGPAVLLSFVIAGLVCACAALAYAEMATMMPAAGSAYTYSYAALGETLAWIVGWSLILEYSLVVSTVAVGWSGYFVGFMQWVGITIPPALRRYAGLTRDCAVIGANTRLEIWDAAAWETYLADQEQQFSDLSEEVLPGIL